MALQAWALPRLSQLLPLDDDSLSQVIEYSSALSKDEAAAHLKNLLGDSASALEFITSFNTRRPQEKSKATHATSVADNGVPKSARKGPRKKQPAASSLPPRRPDDWGDTAGSYMKPAEDDYVSGSMKSKSRNESPHSAGQNSPKTSAQLERRPGKTSLLATPSDSAASSRAGSPRPPKLPPSATGHLISDLPSRNHSRSPAGAKSSQSGDGGAKTKVSLGQGGPAMRASNTPLSDLDAAIRELEAQTNPTLAAGEDAPSRRCDCMAQRHPLLAAAPNCLRCGKIVCAREGVGPCTFCGTPLLSRDDLHGMLQALREERGRERMARNNASHRRADVGGTPRPFAAANSSANSDVEGDLASATAQRDRLLGYQTQNARRTKVHDEVADFDEPTAPGSLWASPVERAAQLRRQQEALRVRRWREKPEWERRVVVAEIDVAKGKVVRRMREVEMPDVALDDEDGHSGDGSTVDAEGPPAAGGGPLGRNPLLGSLIKPVARSVAPEQGGSEGEGSARSKSKPTWRRVQDDYDDNEEVILDGGALGGRRGVK